MTGSDVKYKSNFNSHLEQTMKKESTNSFSRLGISRKIQWLTSIKFSRTMKLSVFLSLCSLGVSYASGLYAQGVTVNIEAKNETVAEILKDIEAQSGYDFFYNNKLVNVNRRVSVSSKNENVFDVLNQVFDGTNVTYSVLDKKIVLSTKEVDSRVTASSSQQSSQHVVKGKVVDANGEPIIGATIVEVGTANGTVTDFDGNFTLNVSGTNAKLDISYIGYKKVVLSAISKSLSNIILKEDMETLDEVVVVAYGTQKKANLTGAVSQVQMDKVLGDRPISTVGAALQGAIPGLVVSPKSTPGADATFNIRGTTSINGGSPLVLIDNVPGDINMLNPEDIESVSVLKDAASAAVYGARSAFGVILITTKQGKKNEKFSVNYNTTLGWQEAIGLPEQVSVLDYIDIYQHTFGNTHYIQSMDMDTWRDLFTQYHNNPSSLTGVEASGRYITEDGHVYLLNDRDHFKDALTGGFQQTHNLSVRGGTERLTYRISFGYVNNNGVLKGSKDMYERLNASSNIKADITDWLSTSLDFRYTKGDQATPDNSQGIIWNVQMPRFFPNGTMVDADGVTQYWQTPEAALSFAPENHTVKKNPRIYSRTSIHPIKGLDFAFEYTYNGVEQDVCTYNGYFSLMHPQNTQITEPKTSSYSNNKVSTDYNAINVTATYEKSFGNHNFKVLAGFTQETSSQKSLNVNRLDMINTDLPSISGGTGEVTATDVYNEYIIRGGYGRINYDYMGKYLFEMNGRYDGSSRFPKENRYGFFPSFSLGWQVGKEKFMKWADSWLNEFKIRGSYGEIGNQNIIDPTDNNKSKVDNYPYIPVMNPQKAGWILGGVRPITLTTPGMVSSDFTWEVAKTLDVGFDLSVLNNRLQATFDWYQRNTEGMLAPGRDLAAEAGASAPRQNAANLRNRGWEITLNWRDNIGDWGYRVGFNLYDSHTYITKYDNPNKDLAMDYYEGMEIGEIWGYVTNGFYTIEDFIPSSEGVKGWQDGVWNLKEGVTTIQGVSPRPGDHKFVNLRDDENSVNRIDTGDNTADNPGDRKVIGNNAAHFQFGANLGVNWKGVDLSVMLQGTGKRDYWASDNLRWGFGNAATGTAGVIFKGQEDFWRPKDENANTVEGWQPVNPDPAYHRYYGQQQNKNSNRRVQTRYLMNAAYLRIKNITLGYTFPKNWVSKVGLANVKVFCSGENLFTFTDMPSGFDPERMSWGYPYYRTISFGVNLTL